MTLFLVQRRLFSQSDFGLWEVTNVSFAGNDDIRVTLGGRGVIKSTASIIVGCPPLPFTLRPPTATPNSCCACEHRTTTAADVRLTRTSTCDDVARDATKLSVDDQVQDKIYGKVWEEQKVSESRGRLERPVGAWCGDDECDDVGRGDENCE